MGWCVVPECRNLAMSGDVCPMHTLDRTVKQAYERKGTSMKVTVAEGYQMKDRNGKLHQAGDVIEVKDAEGEAAVMNGTATAAKAAKPAPSTTTPVPTPTPKVTAVPKPRATRRRSTKATKA